MTGTKLLLTALLVSAVTVIHSAPVQNAHDAMMYLAYYGYVDRQSSDGTVMTEEEMKRGICNFQYMANITQTCELNTETMEKMNAPRCGMPDNVGHAMDARRKRRYSLGSRWSRTALTYRIDNVTPDISNPVVVESTLAQALEVWSNVTSLTFTRVRGNTPADIIIRFVAGEHGDGAPFDGPGNVLAHAFFPENGDAHFDEDETWTIRGNAGFNLLQVGAHEFGHSLGLGHSNVNGALMAPFYPGFQENFRLHPDDIAGIQAHYGVGSGGPDVTMPPNPPPDDIPCTGRVDAVTTTRDRSTYIFEGRFVWKIEPGQGRIAEGFPKAIASTFPGLPNNLDTALYNPPNGKTYFFKGSQYWRFDNEVPDDGYPRDISDWDGLPINLDAAFIWSGNGRAYFIKGDEYYRFNGQSVDAGYPRPLSVWDIPGNQVSAAVQWTNERTYFFSSTNDYYRYNDRAFAVSNGYPRDATLWQACANRIEDTTADPAGNGGDSSGVGGLVPSLLVLVGSAVLGAIKL